METSIRDAFVSRKHFVSIFFIDLEKTWYFIRFIQNGSPWWFINVFPYFLLSDRDFKVYVGNIYSDPYSQEAGVPQGSILFVTLFSLQMNSM